MTGEKIREVGDPIVIRGIGVGRGVAIGPLRYDPIAAEGERRGVAEELTRLDLAREGARGEMLALRDAAVKSVGEEHGEVYSLHISLLDGEPIDMVKRRIEKGERLKTAIEKAREETQEKTQLDT